MVTTKLPSGMDVLVDPTGHADVAAVYVWVRTGSAAEPPGLEGAAHMLEHMVFKGTRSYGVGQVATAIEALGGDLNAFTSFDETAFHCTVPAAKAPQAVAVLAEMLLHATIDAEELERERLVILEEIRGGEDEPELVLGEALWATAFPGHPYGRPVIGTVRSVRGIGRAALLDFYRTWYRPSNAVLSVAGPVDVDAVMRAAHEAFGQDPWLDRAAAGSAAAKPVRVEGGRVTRVLRKGFEGTYLELAWDVGPLTLGEEACLDVLAGALGGGRSSPLDARLRRTEELCLSVGAHVSAERDAGLFTIDVHARPRAASAAVRAVRDVLRSAAAGGVSRADVERARAGILASMAVRRESVDDRAMDAASDLVRHGDPHAWRRYAAEVASVTNEAVCAAARRLFGQEDLGRVALALASRREQVDLAPPDFSAPYIAPRVTGPTRHVLDNGLRVLLEPTDADAASVRVVGLGGVTVEPRGAAGRTVAWARSATRGAAGIDALSFAHDVEALGASVGALGGLSTQAVRGDFTAATLAQGLEIVADVALRPDFHEDEVLRVVREMQAELHERVDEPDVLAHERVWALVFPGHPYGSPPSGTPRSLARLHAAHLRAHHARWARPENLVVSVTGGFDPDSALRRVRRLFGSMRAKGGGGVASTGVVVPRGGSDGPQRGRVRTDREQAHVFVAYAGAGALSEDQPVMELLSGVLGGQGGRLFLDLREERGLAYAVGAASNEGLRSGLLICNAAVEGARLDEAEARLRAVVEGLGERPIPASELDRARATLLGAAESDVQATRHRAAAAALLEVYGFDGTAYRDFVKRRIAALSPEDLQRAAQRLLSAPVAVVRVEPAGSGLRRRA